MDTYPTKDLDGVTIQNTAGDRYDNPPPVPRGIPVLHVTMWYEVDAWAPSEIRNWAEKVNSTAWYDFAAATCTITGITFELIQENGRTFWEVVYTIDVGEQNVAALPGTRLETAGTFPFANMARVANYGYNELPGGSVAAKRAVKDAEGKAVSSPAKLNINGSARTATDEPLFYDYQVRTLGDFHSIIPD